MSNLLSFISVSDINRWIGLTHNDSAHGGQVDHLMGFVHWFMLALFIGWSVYLVYVFTRFRQKNQPRADYYGVKGHASSHIEIGVIIVEVILLIGFAFPLWSQQSQDYPTRPDTIKIRALGEKFLWNFQYAGNDKMISAWHLKHVQSPNNITGKDLNDINGDDDFVSLGKLILPINRPVIIDVASKDVIHNLALPNMRAAQDAIPGVKAHMWFMPTKTGEWEIVCGQLCGPGHGQMKALIKVIEQEEFDVWAKEASTAAAEKATKQRAANKTTVNLH
jgi:cytochrome c oxidase subunit 2